MKRIVVLGLGAGLGLGTITSIAGAQEIQTFDTPNQTQTSPNSNFKFSNPISGSWGTTGAVNYQATDVNIDVTGTNGGYGTAYYNIDTMDTPSVIDISGSSYLQLDVTFVNNNTNGLIVDLQDGEGDYWTYHYGYGLTGILAADQAAAAGSGDPGEIVSAGLATGEEILDVPLATPFSTGGSPTFDFTQLVLFRLEDDPGGSGAAFDDDINFNDISAVNVPEPASLSLAGLGSLLLLARKPRR
jgi:hypothetical protein